MWKTIFSKFDAFQKHILLQKCVHLDMNVDFECVTVFNNVFRHVWSKKKNASSATKLSLKYNIALCEH